VARPLSELSSGSQLREFNTEIKLDRKGKSVVVLTVYGDMAVSKSLALPTVVQGQLLKGRVKFVLDKPDAVSGLNVCVSILSIFVFVVSTIVYLTKKTQFNASLTKHFIYLTSLLALQVQGRLAICASPGEELIFLEIPRTLWSPAMGDPRTVASKYTPPGRNSDSIVARSRLREGERAEEDIAITTTTSNDNAAASSTSPPHKFISKFPAGVYVFHFSFELPQEVSLLMWNGQSSAYRMPQTFSERHTRGSIKYLMKLRMAKGGFLSADEKCV
jgi:hypothetical protein